MRQVEIVIPQYIEELKLSDTRMKKYYKKDEEIPKKFADFLDPTKLKHPYKFKKDRIYNPITKTFPFRNTSSYDKPRMKFIAGNGIWGGRNKHFQQAMTLAVKADFRPHLPTKIELTFPIMIEMEVHTVPRYSNWDIGNLWPYEKIFEDLLQDAGLIPNDNILYITKAGSPRYVPVVHESERKMVFTLKEDTDPRVINHVMYGLNKIKPIRCFNNNSTLFLIAGDSRIIKVESTSDGEPGTVMFDSHTGLAQISSGKKKLLWGSVRKGLRSVFSLAVQQNAHVVILSSFYDQFKQFVEEELQQRGLTVYVYEGGNDISGNSELSTNQISN